MGQHASRGSFEYRYVSEAECFKRKVLLIHPPTAVQRRVGEMPTRIFRSVSLHVGSWDTQTILPEQWMTILGNQLFVIYFVPYRNKILRSTGEEVKVLPTAAEFRERFEFAQSKISDASPDAKIVIAIWDNVEEGLDDAPADEEEEEPEEGAGNGDATDESSLRQKGEDAAEAEGDAGEGAGSNADAGPDAAGMDEEDEEDKPDEATVLAAQNEETLREVTVASRLSGCRVVHITEAKERFALGCLVSACVTPLELSRPLCSLLYQLKGACGASEAFLIDSVSFFPLLSTLNEDPETLQHYLHDTLWVFRTSLRRIMNACDTDLHLMVIPCGPRWKMVVGWACRPYAYVMLLVPHELGTSLMVEKNLEGVSMHFYNVINNTTTRKTYNPITTK